MNKKIYIIISLIISCILITICVGILSPTSTKNVVKYDNEVKKLSDDELNIYYNNLVNFNTNIKINMSYSGTDVININEYTGYIMIPSLNIYEGIGSDAVNLYEKCEIPFKNTNTKMYINKVVFNNIKTKDVIYVKILNKTLRYVVDEILDSDENINSYNANQSTLNIRIKTLSGHKVLKCILTESVFDEKQNIYSLMNVLNITSIIFSLLIIIYILNRKIKKYRIQKNIKKESYYENLRKQHIIECEDEVQEIGTITEIIKNEKVYTKENDNTNMKKAAGIQLFICGIVIFFSLLKKRKER